MFSKVAALSILLAVAQARFGQEQTPIAAIGAVQGGGPGVAATIAGNAVSDLLAAANPCAKLQRGDQILAQLGNGTDAIAAAKGFVAAEKNFNPFVTSIPSICSDPTLPTNEILRGITPLIDPAVLNAAAVNTLSKKSLTTPFDAVGKSVADVLRAQGFSNFTAVALDGTKVGPVGSSSSVSLATASETAVQSAIESASSAATTVVATTSSASDVTITSAASTASGVIDYGLCDPQMDFVGGRPNRKSTEFTFLPIDKLTSQGQEEALNPNIITNRICDQLTNVCQSNAAAKAQCQTCKAKITALGTRNQGTADAWNECVIAGTSIKQDLTSGVVSGTAATTLTGSAASATGINYGLCDPQLDFVAGRPGRKATEFTFLPIDPLTKQGQEEALNPNIITNRICDQLTNVCAANQAAKNQCLACKAKILALGTRNQSTADAWNECVIAGTNIKEDTTSGITSTADVTTTTSETSATDIATTDASTTETDVATSTDASTTETDVATSTDASTTETDVATTTDTGVVTMTMMVTVTSISTTTVAGDCSTTVTATSTTASAIALADVSSSAAAAAATTSGVNVQPFTGSLGVAAIPVLNVGGSRPFVVNGDSFINFGAACHRSCDVQHNKCANVANAGGATFTVSDCDTQDSTCGTGCAAGPKTVTRRVKREERRRQF